MAIMTHEIGAMGIEDSTSASRNYLFVSTARGSKFSKPKSNPNNVPTLLNLKKGDSKSFMSGLNPFIA